MEARRLLTTTGVFSGGSIGYSTPDGVTASWTAGADASSEYDQGFGLRVNGIAVTADSYTLDLTGLPAHSMVQVQVDEDAGPWYADNGSGTVEVSAGSSPQTTSLSTAHSQDHSANWGEWFASSDSSLSVTLSAQAFTRRCGYFVPDVTVFVYQPTVTISGGGNTNEATPISDAFTAHRDLPAGWLGTPAGDAPIPNTTVNLSSPTGTAEEGVDYQILPRTVTLTASGTSKTIAFTPINDNKSENYDQISKSMIAETATIELLSGDGYDLPTPPYAFSASVTLADDTYNITRALVMAGAAVQTAIAKAWTDSHSGQADAHEVSFDVYWSLKTSQLEVIFSDRLAGMEPDESPKPNSNPAPWRVMVANFHTHPDNPSTGRTYASGMASDGDKAVIGGAIGIIKEVGMAGYISFGEDTVSVPA